MIVLDALEHTAAFTGKDWPQLPWKAQHLMYKFQAYGSIFGEIGGVNDYGLPSVYIADGSYAVDATWGAIFAAAEYICPDYEDWPFDWKTCPHTNEMIAPYDAIDNRHQTSLDVVPQIPGQHYAFYDYGPRSTIVGAGNLCYEPHISEDQDHILHSLYLFWPSYPTSIPSVENFLGHARLRGQECAKHITIPSFFQTSFMYADAGEPVVIQIAEWRRMCAIIFHNHSGLGLWYHKESSSGGAYIIPWSDAAVQANVAAIQEEYDKLWTNNVVGAIEGVAIPITFTVTTTVLAEDFELFLNQSASEPNFIVDWGDGNSDTITSKNSFALTHTYASIGAHTITLTGTVPGLAFIDDWQGVHRAKITNITNFGTQTFETLRGAFYGLVNAVSTSPAQKYGSGVSDWESCFHLFGGNPDVSACNTSSATTFRGMFFDAANANPNCAPWVIANLTDASLMLNGSGISTANLEALLNSWQAQPHQNNVTLDAVDTARSAASDIAVAALEVDGWIINTL